MSESVVLPMAALAAGWLAAILLLYRTLNTPHAAGVGITLAYVLATMFEYCGGFAYAMPGYTHLRPGSELFAYLANYRFDEETILRGLTVTSMGLFAFVLGALLASRTSPVAATFDRVRAAPLRHYRSLFMVLGAIATAGFVLNTVRLPIPLIDAFNQVGRNAAIVFVCLGAYLAVRRARQGLPIEWLALAAMIPAAYLLVWGFISFGFYAFTVMASFALIAIFRGRIGTGRFALGLLGVGYVLLSLFVAYMSFRNELRIVLWSDAGFADRLWATLQAFSGVRLLDPTDFESLDWLVTRLNQGLFVGKAIEHHALYETLRLNGESLLLALVAWVPRFLWPAKPGMGGSEFVSEHTGLTFADGVTFGSGPILELFANFGSTGVVVGMFALGVLIRTIDHLAGAALRSGALLTFAMWFTVGLGMVRPLSDVFFMVNTAVATFAVFFALRLLALSRVPVGSRHRARSF